MPSFLLRRSRTKLDHSHSSTSSSHSKMGTTPSKPVSKPFDAPRSSRPWRRRRRNKQSTLLKLIALKDWQKVLIRCSLFPNEITQVNTLEWYGVAWDVLPLHLACALEPPAQVIAKLLQCGSTETASVFMLRKTTPKKRGLARMRAKSKPPSIESSIPHNGTQDTSFDSSAAFSSEGLLASSGHSHHSGVYSLEQSLGGDEDNSLVGSEGSLTQFLGHQGLVLQLSPSGGIQPISFSESRGGFPPQQPELSPESSPHEEPNTMNWNLEPLLHQAEEFLPLHIASLYQASPQVLRLLWEAHPLGAQTLSLGMLPIHMICAGFPLPPPMEAPAPTHPNIPCLKNGFKMVDALAALAELAPASLGLCSEAHGMSALDYIEETLEEGPYKDHCRRVVQAAAATSQDREGEMMAEASRNSATTKTASTGTPDYEMSAIVPSEILCDDTTTLASMGSDSDLAQIVLPQSKKATLTSLMKAKEWKVAFSVLEEDPFQACEWQYGIEVDRFGDSDEPQLWKRLPIHQACALHAPVGLLEALFQAFPKGVVSEDPYTGALPLHLACHYRAPPVLVDAILKLYPRGTRTRDKQGRLPMHMACLAGARLSVIQSLIKAHPHSVSQLDDKKKTPLDYAKCCDHFNVETALFMKKIRKLLELEKEAKNDACLSAIAEEDSVAQSTVTGEQSTTSKQYFTVEDEQAFVDRINKYAFEC